MIQITLPANLNVLPKLWKQFNSLNVNKEVKKERNNEEDKNVQWINTPDESEDDGLRWDRYGNPYIFDINSK